jgi:hypothetical protein
MPDDVETKIKAEEYSSMLFSDYRAIGGFDELKDVYEYYLKHPNHYKMNNEKIDLYTMFVDVLSKNKKEQAFLYEVEIPDDNGSNYIDWYKPVDYSYRFNIMRKISYLEERFNFEFSDSLYELLTTNRSIPGSVLYKTLSGNLWSDKAASLLLMQCRFDGIKYPSGTKWQKPDGASEYAMNYVIFDANKVKIVNKIRV